MDSDDAKAHLDGGRADSACSACHRRKLKCDRTLDGCSNCQKSDIPCIYDAHSRQAESRSNTRDSRRKPRGPYKKGKTPREKELEHVVEILQEKIADLNTQGQNQTPPSDQARSSISHGSPSNALSEASSFQFRFHNQPASSLESGTFKIAHPSPSQMLELWIIYLSSFDVMTKIVHPPTLTVKILRAKEHPDTLEASTEALLLAVYLAALNTLDTQEVSSRFGAEKETLVARYQTALNSLLRNAETSNLNSLEMLQAAVISLACLRRQPGPGASIPSLFALAVKLARRLGLHDANSYATITPFEAEMRRRVWWMICRHESAYAEEVNTRKTSIMLDTDIALPKNYNDDDLDPNMPSLPSPRVGITDMSFVLLAVENVRTVARLAYNLLQKSEMLGPSEMKRSRSLREQSRELWGQTRNRIEREILQFCDASRPFDLLLLIVSKIVMTKSEILILDQPAETDIAARNAFHDMKVTLSLDIIECHELVMNESRLHKYRSNYQHIHQWFAIIYVLEEVARRPDAAFAPRVWQVIDTVLIQPDLLNKHGMQVEHRKKLLEAHGQALESRESLLRTRSMTAAPPYVEPTNTMNDDIATQSEQILAVEPSSMRIDPWGFDQSLFDVQDVQLNFDAFFWPQSLQSPSAMVTEGYESGHSNIPPIRLPGNEFPSLS